MNLHYCRTDVPGQLPQCPPHFRRKVTVALVSHQRDDTRGSHCTVYSQYLSQRINTRNDTSCFTQGHFLSNSHPSPYLLRTRISAPHFFQVPNMATPQPLSFGFVGLGNMGSVMSQNLATYAQSQGLPKVQLWNRTRSKIEKLAQEGFFAIADSLEDLVTSCDVIHACLANDEVALSIYRQILRAAKPSLILVDHSTLFPTTSSTLRTEADAQGSSFLSCPVFGPPAAAKNAGLLVVISGNAAARDTLKSYIVPTLGKAVIDCGDDTSKGALLKILGNSCILGTIELMSESFTLAEKTGFDVGKFYEFIRKSCLFQTHSPRTWTNNTSLF